MLLAAASYTVKAFPNDRLLPLLLYILILLHSSLRKHYQYQHRHRSHDLEAWCFPKVLFFRIYSSSTLFSRQLFSQFLNGFLPSLSDLLRKKCIYKTLLQYRNLSIIFGRGGGSQFFIYVFSGVGHEWQVGPILLLIFVEPQECFIN